MLSGNTEVTVVMSGIAHSGSYAADLGPYGSLGFISQTVATTPGARYLFSWWLQSDGGTPNEFQASWNGAVLLDQLNVPAGEYQLYSYTVTATGTSTTVSLGFRDDPGYLHLDDVSVVPVMAAATFTTSSLTAGTHTITAVYAGTVAGSALNQIVGKVSSSPVLTLSAQPSLLGQSVTFTATIAPTIPGAGTPTGLVTFNDGSTLLGTAALNGNGVATLTVASLTVATHTITAGYSGDTNYGGGSSTKLLQTVEPYNLSGGILTVYGAGGKDMSTAVAESGQFILNGVTCYYNPALVNVIRFLGKGGTDTVYLTGTGSNDTATLGPGSGQLNGASYEIEVAGVANIVVTGGGGNDTAYLTDAGGNNTFNGTPTEAGW